MLTACPNCQFEPLQPGTNYCPRCGQSLEIATRVDIHPTVGQNLGRVVGVETSTINGNVYGGDIFQVQVYVLNDSGRKRNAQELFNDDRSPYKFLSPYTINDRPLFFGRENETVQVLQRIGMARLLVLYGAAGVGKSSLIAAGVIPELIGSGALVFHIHDYAQPISQTLLAALGASQQEIPIQVAADASLATVINTLYQATKGTIILVCDQCEQLFLQLPAELRASHINQVIDALNQVAPEYFRMVLVLRDDALVRLGDLQQALPDVFQHFMELKALSREQARRAIIEPAQKVKTQISYQPGVVDNLLLPDLDELTPDSSDAILPVHLQIVCTWLYDKAIQGEAHIVDQDLYLGKARTAAGILAGYLEETLATRLADQRDLAEKVLIYLASPTTSDWVLAQDMQFEGVQASAISSVLENLVQSGLLISHSTSAGVVYSLAGQALLEEIYKLAGPEFEIQRQAGKDLKRVWQTWLAHQEFASRQELERLAQAGAALSPDPLECLLLLHSAVAVSSDLSPWIAQLNTEKGRKLVGDLEGIPSQLSWQFSLSDIDLARQLLSLYSKDGNPEDGNPDGHPSSPEREPRKYGPLAETAVLAELPASRQTAAIALGVPGPADAIDRLTWALQAQASGFHRFQRKAELFGALREAYPELNDQPLPISAPDRLGIWVWRVAKRISTDFKQLGWLGFYAALGAGLGLALLRFFTAWLSDKTPGLHAMLNFFYGALLAVGLFAGVILANYLRLAPARPQRAAPARSDWKTVLISMLFGGIGFCLASLFIALTSGSLSLGGKVPTFGLWFACRAAAQPGAPPAASPAGLAAKELVAAYYDFGDFVCDHPAHLDPDWRQLLQPGDGLACRSIPG